MFRPGTSDDLVALRDLERTANLAALSHVFPPDRFPFPDDDVLARWRMVLDDADVSVRVYDDPHGDGLVAYAAHDSSTLRHIAVRPDHWGRGLATSAIEEALQDMHRRGCMLASLWVLRENHRARRVYEHVGWSPTLDVREAPWPPYPTELRYERLTAPSGR